MLKQTLATVSLLAASAAFAGTPAPQPPVEPAPEPALISYSNFSLEYSYMSGDLDLGFTSLDSDAHGVQAAIEYSPVEHLYLAFRGGWHDVDVDLLGLVDLDFDYWNLNGGVGGYYAITPNIHLVAEVGASYADISLNNVAGINADDWGIYVTPHVRAKFGAIEAHAGVTYNSNDLAPAEWTAFARILFEVAPRVDVYVGGTAGINSGDNAFDDLFGVQGGVRVKF
jgi:hypothetical protein